MELILSLLVWCLKNAWVFTLFSILVLVLTLTILRKRQISTVNSATDRLAISRRIVWAGLIFFTGIFLTVIAYLRGNYLSNEIIYRYGKESTAVVIDRERTGIVYNLHNVSKYRVTYKLADGREFENTFKDSDFILYPNKNDIIAPSIDDILNIKYLAGFPQYFIILTITY